MAIVNKQVIFKIQNNKTIFKFKRSFKCIYYVLIFIMQIKNNNLHIKTIQRIQLYPFEMWICRF